jgi:thiol-disulfide isomerase/thioredoxin
MTRLRPLCFVLLTLAASAAAAAPVALAVETLDGTRFDLAEQRGQWVVVNFWATWCGPCIKEMPDLDALDGARDDVRVIGLAYEETTAADLKHFLTEHPVSYPIALVDVYAPPAAFATPKGLPTTHLIGPDGELRQSFLGPVSRADIEKLISAAIPTQNEP